MVSDERVCEGRTSEKDEDRSVSMRVLVTFAVEAEFAPWRRYRKFEEIRHGLCSIYSSYCGEIAVDVILTGIGNKSPWVETTKRLWDGDVAICISSGLGGALRPELQIGQVLAAKMVRSASWSKSILSDEALLRTAVETGACEVGSFYSADHVVVSAKEKQELGKISDVVEMESGGVLYEATAFGARAIAIRGISDGAEEDLPLDFNRVTTPTGEVSLPKVLGEVATHLTAVPSLIRFGQQSRMAAEKLAAFLDRYVEAIAGKCNTFAKQAVIR
jgi:adenosylhomocysteine nucleosidase